MIGRNPLLHLVIRHLISFLATLAAGLIVGRILRWTKIYLVAVWIVFGILVGLGGMMLCIVFDQGALMIGGYAFIGTVFTASFIVCWRDISTQSEKMEAELAKWLERRGSGVVEAL